MKIVRNWSRLDNAAKIFPPTSSRKDSKVFRFACELYETVDPQVLQHALDRTIVRFPFYKSILRRGMFWYYLEESEQRPIVKEENEYPCAPLYNADRPGLLFRVCYYKKRINLEVFHALTDGMGAVHFLRTLVSFYLAEKHPDCTTGKFQLDEYDPSQEQILQDAFEKYYDKDKKVRHKKANHAYRLRGTHLPDNRIGIIEGVLSVKDVLKNAHEYHASMSEFLTAVLLCSVNDGMAVRDRLHPAVITVPVNLRQFFPTQTARNFFGIIHIGYDFKGPAGSFPEVLAKVHSSFKKQLIPENMLEIINRYASLENNFLIKAIPLEAKIPCLKLAGRWEEREDTAAFSNIGKIAMPPEMAGFIRLFDAFVSTRHPQICLCSFGDTLAISYSSKLESTDLPRCFFRRLTDMGIDIEINSNLEQSEEEADAVL